MQIEIKYQIHILYNVDEAIDRYEGGLFSRASIIWNKHYLDIEFLWWIEKLNYKSLGDGVEWAKQNRVQLKLKVTTEKIFLNYGRVSWGFFLWILNYGIKTHLFAATVSDFNEKYFNHQNNAIISRKNRWIIFCGLTPPKGKLWRWMRGGKNLISITIIKGIIYDDFFLIHFS